MSNSKDSWRDNKGNTYNVEGPYRVRVHNPQRGTRYISEHQFNLLKQKK